ncbi:MAG: hypothetical protein JKY43_10120 [Phycisphaerales bacterium]|nr:hypothetical protein [Phycisphaerales bacterium]
MTPPRITLVGHCRPDVFALTAAVRGFIPNAEVVGINSEDQMSDPTDLYLVNRILDGSFPSESGIELIRNLSDGSPPAILITNIEEHAVAAIQAGACPGFGKADSRTPKAEQALRSALKMEAK